MTNCHDTERESCPHAGRIDALLGQMRMLCCQIDQIGQTQQKQLDDGDFEAFVASLESRNPKIASLADAGKLVENLLDGDEYPVRPAQVEAARKQLDEMAEMVIDILQRDGQQQIVIEKKRSELSDQLSGVGTAQTAIRAYSGGGGVQATNPTLQDRKG